MARLKKIAMPKGKLKWWMVLVGNCKIIHNMTVVLTNPYWKAVKSQSSTLLFYHPHASQLPYTINTRCTMIIT